MYSSQPNDGQVQAAVATLGNKHRYTIYFVDPIVATVGFDEGAFDGEE